MKVINDLDGLKALYPAPMPLALNKVMPELTPLYQKWIAASRFLVLSTVGPEGTDGSPRGDDGPVAQIADTRTLLIPDWRGNSRLDSLRNIVRDGRVSLMFMVAGCNNVVRVNGRAVLSDDADLVARFEQRGKRPTLVIVVTVHEAYYQCAKALMRSGLWTGAHETAGLPTAGSFNKEVDPGFDAASYDSGYSDYAKGRMW